MALQRLSSRRDRWMAGGCTLVLLGVVAFFGLRSAHLVPAGIAGIGLTLVVLLAHWHAGQYAYRCPHCAQHFEIGTSTDLISPHSIGRRYLTCPCCGRREWAAVVSKAKVR